MERYICQLIEDLEQVAKKPPTPAYIEPPEHLMDKPEIAELALVPFKTIEELTRINQEVFPEINDLQGDQWERVNQAIFKVLESLNISLIDIPPNMPQEWLYEVLTSNWGHPVQYLPLSGMDLELCTGDPQTCPYGEYCDCGEDFDEYELPEKFMPCINAIAESINSGFVCYLNPESTELEEIPQALLDDPDEFEMITGLRMANEEFKHKEWNEYYTFIPLTANESFEIMESFAVKLDDEIQSEELLHALNQKKPFSKFNAIIEKSKQNSSWFLFKTKWLENHVRQIIYSKIHQLPENPDDEELPF